MQLKFPAAIVLSSTLAIGAAIPASAAEQGARSTTQQKVRVTGTVRDDSNAITLPGVPVEVSGAGQIVYTDVDGRYVLDLEPGAYQLKVGMEGYEERTVALELTAAQRNVVADVGLSMAKFAETVTVTAAAPLDAITSTQEAQLIERRNAPVITDNLGSEEMKANADGDAAAAMSRVTGLSVVDNQYVFVRGLGERYSNTTLAGAVIPTTEPDKKVVPLDMFPAGLLDSVQVNKSYSPDRSAEFAGGLVQIVPLKLPRQAVVDFSYGLSHVSTATGKSIPLSPIDGNDVFGYNRGARSLPSSIPPNKIVRRGIYTPDAGYSPEQTAAFGRAFDNSVWRPVTAVG